LASRLSGALEERKQKIARATCMAIVQQGLHRVNMRDIARALGTTTGPLQHYFRSKDELLLYTKNLLIDELLENTRKAGMKHRGATRLRVICETLLPFTPAARMAWRVLTAFNGRAIGDAELTAIQVLRYSKCREFFESELKEARDSGVLASNIDVALEATALASFVFGLAVQMLFLSEREIRRLKKGLVRHYLRRSFSIAVP
jgi:TetR/AcrR family transcriptional regulator, transcriptional repressor of bet genes